VVVAGADGLLDTAKQAATAASAAKLVPLDLHHVATGCAEARPYAIVVSKDVYEFGGSEFDALARDLSAGLIVVPETIAMPLLVTLLQEEARRLG
jgi:hypothetical protein